MGLTAGDCHGLPNPEHVNHKTEVRGVSAIAGDKATKQVDQQSQADADAAYAQQLQAELDGAGSHSLQMMASD